MPKALSVALSDPQREMFEAMRDCHPKPHMRERAAALLKIAGGRAGYAVAEDGLLKPRKRDTVYTWVHRYEEQGLGGLYIRDGRGRKPAFSPSALDSGRSPRGAVTSDPP